MLVSSSADSRLDLETVGARQVQICNDHGKLLRIPGDGCNGRPAVMRRCDLETLAATELGKQFPRADIVVYNERFLFGQLH
jgi:hypothetical protein